MASKSPVETPTVIAARQSQETAVLMAEMMDVLYNLGALLEKIQASVQNDPGTYAIAYAGAYMARHSAERIDGLEIAHHAEARRP